MDCDYLFKVVLIGDGGVGKTNIMTKFSRNMFNVSSKSTIGVDFSSKNIILDDKNIKIQIWDTAGQERYKAVTSSYYRNSSGILLVYDITNSDSYYNCSKWLNELRSNTDPNTPVILIGNKNDMIHQRNVSIEDAAKFAKENGLMFLETSALDGNNIEEAFVVLSKRIYDMTISTSHQTTLFKSEIIESALPPTTIPISKNTINEKKSCC